MLKPSLLLGVTCSLLLGPGCTPSPEDQKPATPETPQPDAKLVLPAASPNRPAASAVRFVDVHAEAGLAFRNVSGSSEQRYILESLAGGIASFDYDSDGYQDLFVVDGTRIDGAPEGAGNRLFRNEAAPSPSSSTASSTRTFRDVTAAAGLVHSAWGMGCAVGDVDEDGSPDLYVAYWGRDLYYHNEGDGTFTERAATAGLGSEAWGTSAAFGDLDGDGLLDLYVANYLEFDLNNPPAGGNWCAYKGLNSYCGPEGIPPQADRLYRNIGDGRFADVSEETGIGSFSYPGLGVSLVDVDDDGDLDVYVANDSDANLLFRNDGAWQFAEIATVVGLAYSENGRAQAGMGVDSGDFDNDGDLDLYVTNFSDDVNTLYENQGAGWFTDGTYSAGMGGVVRPYLGWSACFFDYDNDGWLDLFVANGHVYPQLAEHPAGLQYAQRNLLYHNRSGRFEEVGLSSGPGLALKKVSRACAVFDYDNDGDADLVVVNLNDEPSLLRNDGGNGYNWLGLRLVGGDSNRDAIGARVRVRAGDLEQTREVQRARGFQAQSDPRLLFGLGEREQVESVDILWPSGKRQVVKDPPLRRYLEIHEGHEEIEAGPVVPAPLAVTPAGPSTPPVPPEISQRASSPAERLARQPGAPPSRRSPADLRKAGEELYRQGRYAEARAALEEVVELEPDDVVTHVNMGLVLYAGMGRYGEAAAVLERALQRQPRRADALHLLGKAYLRQHRVAEAIRALAGAAGLSRSWEYDNWLGLAYMRADSLERAESAFKRAARLAPWEPRPHLHLSHVYEALDLPEAARGERDAFERLNPAQRRVEHYSRKVREYLDNVRARLLLGQAYAEQERWQEASKYFRRAVEMDSLFAPAYHAQGSLLHRQDMLPKAIKTYEWALRIDPHLLEAHNDLGQAYHQIGQYKKAIASYRRALELSPDQALVHSNLGMAYAMAGRLDEAATSFKNSIVGDSTLADARDGLAQVYAAQGSLERAIAEWEAVLRLDPRHPRAAALLPQVRERLRSAQRRE
jgi:tetratricopeptide (TPR) repeat protein